MNVMNYKEELKGLCCVEVSGEDCANCLTLMPIVKEICDSLRTKILHDINACHESVCGAILLRKCNSD